jgi:hypothetical protein
MNFNSTNGFLQTTISLDTKLPGTQIFALQNSSKGEVWYPNGVNMSAAMEITEGDWVEFTDFDTKVDGNILTLTVSNHEYNGHRIRLSLS